MAEEGTVDVAVDSNACDIDWMKKVHEEYLKLRKSKKQRHDEKVWVIIDEVLLRALAFTNRYWYCRIVM